MGCRARDLDEEELQMNPKVAKVLVLSLVLGLLFSVPLRAQVVGATLSGTITDPRGGAIPGAKVSAKNLATGASTSTTTNATGAFSIANLNPADYEVSSSAAGFSTVQTRVTLTVGAKQEVNLVLKVGQLTEIVEVTGAAPTVETTNSTLSAEVDSTTMRELPLNGRDWASLATLQPGVASVRTQEVITQVGAVGRGLGSQMSIDGNRPTQNTYRLNGLIVNDYSNAGPGNVLGGNLGVDAIQEFSVITSNYSAEYGYTSGGVVNAVTKSGTNQFHGSVFEFIRNSALDAKNFFENSPINLPKAEFRRNQFGGSGGGPIKKDKFWIFGAYEGLRQSKGIPHSTNVPSAAALAGSSHQVDAQGNLFPVQVVVNQPYLTFFPHCAAGAPINPPGDTCVFSFSGAQVVPDNYYNFRGDLKLSDKDTMTGAFYYDHSTFTQPDNFNQKLEGFFVGRKGASIEETHLFGASTVNTLRLGWNYTQGFGQLTPSALNPDAASTGAALAIQTGGTHAARLATIGGGGNTAAGFNQAFSGGLNGDAVEDFTHQTVQTFDDAGRTIGKHSLKFGFMFIRLEEKLYAPFTSNGTVFYASPADFLTNTPAVVQSPPVGGIKTVAPFYTFTSIPGVYLNDDWKVRPNLTLNLGLRYEMETIPTEKNGRIANLPNIWTNPTTENCSVCSNKSFLSNPTSKNFEPRVGFAWDPFRDGKTSVRGGFGLFDSLPLPYELALNNAQTSPGHVNVNVPGCSVAGGLVVSPPPCIAQGQFPNVPPDVLNEFLTHSAAPIAGQTWNFVERNPHRNYIYQFNLNLQRQLAQSLSLTVAYAGSRAKHNPYQTDDLNIVFPTKVGNRWVWPTPIGSGCITAAAPGSPVCGVTDVGLGLPATFSTNPTGIVSGLLINGNVGGIQSTLWQSKSWYNALQVELEKRMSHGLQAQVSFTWSKTMDTTSGSFAGDNFAGDLNPTIPWWDLKLIKGLSDFNVSRNLVANLLWEVPTSASIHGPAAFIAKGWEFGGILTLSDGVPVWPFTITSDILGQKMSEPYDILDRVPGCKLTNPGNPNQYINPACFTPPPANNVLGNTGRNIVIGPGLFQLDTSMVKNTKVPKISENFNVQFRAEFFNILNRANFAPPVNNLDVLASGFGTINTTQGPERQIQFGLKFIW
jgi:hypothetical protein